MSSVTITNTCKAGGSSESPVLIHATTILVKNQGVLLIGPSGSGKSDLALRLIDRGAELVSDDYSLIHHADGEAILTASPPPNIAGLLEIRGLGIVALPFCPKAKLALAVTLAGDVERMPDKVSTIKIAGVDMPLFSVNPFEASAAIKIEMKIACLLGDILLKD